MKVEHVDSDGNTWEIPFFQSDDIETLLRERADEVHSAIMDSLTNLIVDKLDQVPSFSVNEFVFEVNRDTAQDNLDKCLDYYEDTEQFENCSRIMTLKSRL